MMSNQSWQRTCASSAGWFAEFQRRTLQSMRLPIALFFSVAMCCSLPLLHAMRKISLTPCQARPNQVAGGLYPANLFNPKFVVEDGEIAIGKWR